MSRVVVKVSYHNPKSSSKNISGYAKYVATREGVELRDQDTTYADYIATRPGVEKCGVHGLFSYEDKPVSLKEVSEELKEYKGNVWTVIVSLKREDATKTGYDNSNAWRELLEEKARDIAKSFNLPICEMNCYAAFHDAKDHPHIHMIIYSKNPTVYSGYHKETALQDIKSMFTRSIFKEELSDIYTMKSEYRDELRQEGCNKIRELAQSIRENKEVSPELKSKFEKLVARLSCIEGKKAYGYLPEDAKRLADDVLRELASDSRIQELYDKWYEQKAIQQQFYNSKEVVKVPLEKNEEFRSILNAIVKEASRINCKVDVYNKSGVSQASAHALDGIMDMLCQVFVHEADEMDLDNDNQQIVEAQSELDDALGIKHEGGPRNGY